jgi:hypothetical protein
MKSILTNLLLITLFLGPIAIAQEKFTTKTGVVFFEANVPSFEPVEAKHSNVSAILKNDGTFAALALVNGFRFEIALMEEHFNENFAESATYPKITFKGKIQNFNASEVGDEPQEFILDGTFNMHGTDKQVSIPIKLNRKDEILYLETQFILKPEDFDIKIPKVVSKKIAEEVTVTVNLKLE